MPKGLWMEVERAISAPTTARTFQLMVRGDDGGLRPVGHARVDTMGGGRWSAFVDAVCRASNASFDEAIAAVENLVER